MLVAPDRCMRPAAIPSFGLALGLLATMTAPALGQEDVSGVAEQSQSTPAVGEEPQPPLLPPPPSPPPGTQPWGEDPLNERDPATRLRWPGEDGSPHVDRRPASKPRIESRWYGWQTLTVDGVALLLMSEGSIPVYVLGGPIVHWANGNWWRGVGSLSLRIGTPVLLGLGAGAMCSADRESDNAALGCALLGATIGVATAIAVDASVIAREKVVVQDELAVSLGPVKVTPTVSVSDKQGQVMLMGTF